MASYEDPQQPEVPEATLYRQNPELFSPPDRTNEEVGQPVAATGSKDNPDEPGIPAPAGDPQILDILGRPMSERKVDPLQVQYQQERAMFAQLPPEAKADYLLSKMKLSQQENIRLSRLQNAIGAVQARDDLSAESKADLITQLQTGVNPLIQRQARANMLLSEQSVARETARVKQVAANEQLVRESNAQAIDKSIGVSVDPRNGDHRQLYMKPDGTILPIPEDPVAIAKRKDEQKRVEDEKVKVQGLVDKREKEWHTERDKVEKQVDKAIEDRDALNATKPESGVGSTVSDVVNAGQVGEGNLLSGLGGKPATKEEMIANAMRSKEFGGTWAEEEANIRKRHGQAAPAGATPAATAPVEHKPFDIAQPATMNPLQKQAVADLQQIKMIAPSIPGARDFWKKELVKQADENLALLQKRGSVGAMDAAEKQKYTSNMKTLLQAAKDYSDYYDKGQRR